MSSCLKTLLALALAGLMSAALAQGKSYPGIGRAATPAEVAAWDIDVRPDFKGLPPGSGSVAKGQEIWEAKCASCHGVFGESNQVFAPLVGGTSAQDVQTGRAATLLRTDYPGRTTMMKVATLSTLWDYINRAMPWNQPKSLAVDEVYAVTAFLLNLADVLPADFTLSDQNIRQVQQRLPNRLGMRTDHALWPGPELGGRSRPDVQAAACMKNCPVPTRQASTLPEFARNAHGNLAEQNRDVGAQRGVDTSRPQDAAVAANNAAALASLSSTASPAAAPAARDTIDSKLASRLTQKNNCTACHAADRRVLGPSWSEIAGKHAGKTDYLVGKIRSGGSGTWGPMPMPPQTLDEAQARLIATWLATGAKP